VTPEERFDRIEHITAGIAEERRRDREEYKALWRESQERWRQTQDQIDKLSHDLVDSDRQIRELGIYIRELAADSRASDERLGARIDALVSAIGGHIQMGHPDHHRAIEQLAQRVTALEQQSSRPAQ
jgi:chromosome segregation ATPase